MPVLRTIRWNPQSNAISHIQFGGGTLQGRLDMLTQDQPGLSSTLRDFQGAWRTHGQDELLIYCRFPHFLPYPVSPWGGGGGSQFLNWGRPCIFTAPSLFLCKSRIDHFRGRWGGKKSPNPQEPSGAYFGRAGGPALHLRLGKGRFFFLFCFGSDYGYIRIKYVT